jgi:glucuronate isomerase
MILDANRLFPADGEARSVAARLYETVKDLPIISPHGHTDPRWFAFNEPFPNPTALLIQPDHYIFRMLYSQGVSMESLGIPQLDGKENADPREVWRIFAKNYYLFRGTPTRLWLDYALENQFGLTKRLNADNADEYYELIAKELQTPEFSLTSSTSKSSPPPTLPSTPWSTTKPSANRDGRVASSPHSVRTLS